jgi:catechol 2,3-dioxygenase-like lactoylglutathione lyase family enzyme
VPDFTGIAHVELTVTDLEASERWYGEVLGLKRVFHEAQPERGIIATAMRHDGTGTVIAFTQHQLQPASTGFARFSAVQPGLDHLSFAVRDRAELQAWVSHLQGLGVEYTPLEEWSHGAAVTFRDPDGIALELYVRGQKPV